MIKCGKCGWKSTATSECDAESEFTDHVMDCHVVKDVDTRVETIHDLDVNIQETKHNGRSRYGIYIGRSLLTAYGYMNFVTCESLVSRSERLDDTDKDMVFNLAKDIANYLGTSVHHTEFSFPNVKYITKVI